MRIKAMKILDLKDFLRDEQEIDFKSTLGEII
jgi:hypothetical protein